jgi:predicted DNA-binding protein (MmcQ/YjbR family)
MPATRTERQAQQVRSRLKAFALGLPGAWEDHPWGESVVKVGKKVFVFLGLDVDHPEGPGMSVKLVRSHPLALAQPGVQPTGYGLGRAGWVSLKLRQSDLPYEVLCEWLEESYRTVAPKKLVGQLGPRASEPRASAEGGASAS